MMITITPEATQQIQNMLTAEAIPNLFLRIGVNEGGCSGFSYGMGFDDEQKDSDHVIDAEGFRIVVDQDSMKYLQGLRVDFQPSAMGGGFTLDNPNASVTCGCGSSFRTASDAGKPAPEGEC